MNPQPLGPPHTFVRLSPRPQNASLGTVSAVSAPSKPIEVALVEDREDLRAQLAHTIGRDPSLRLMRAYPNAESALADLPARRPDVVLMDINLPGLDGVECVRQLKVKMPEVQFVMLTIYEDGSRLFQSLMAGASGYLLKRISPEKLLEAIHEVHGGGVPMTAEMARRVIQHFQGPQPAQQLPGLTPREREVLQQLAKGFRYKEIEDNLQMSTGTLRTYVASIYKKLHVHSRTEAVVKYLTP
jgi:DNA-binding NarL/FixJ family response regulator